MPERFSSTCAERAPDPGYFSPERVLGGDISVADDTWALAVTLYALLTGKAAFAGSTEARDAGEILAASPARLSSFEIEDDDLQNLLDRAFRREMSKRMTNVSEFRRALEEWHPDRGVAALTPIDDEDTNDDDDEGMRTLLVPMRSIHDLGRAIAEPPRNQSRTAAGGMRKVDRI